MDSGKRHRVWDYPLSEDEVDELQRRIRRAGPVRQPFEAPIAPQVFEVPPKSEREIQEEIRARKIWEAQEAMREAAHRKHEEEMALWRKKMEKQEFRKDLIINVIGWSIPLIVIFLLKGC